MTTESRQNWMKFYFCDPHPEKFVAEVRQLAAEGLLESEQGMPSMRALPSITFLSRVMAANPSEVRGWLEALCDLPKDALPGVEFAAWLSDAPEAKAWLKERTQEPLFAGAPPDMLEREMDHPVMLDVMWSYYFATGELRAVRRIISVLEYMSDYGAAERFRETAQTEEDRARALRDAMFQAASWSLKALMQEHPPLKDFCGRLVRSRELSPNQACALAIDLSRLDPELWNVHIDPVTSQAQISWKDPS